MWKVEPHILQKMRMKIGSFLHGSGNKNDGNATTTKLVKHEKILQSQAQKDWNLLFDGVIKMPQNPSDAKKDQKGSR